MRLYEVLPHCVQLLISVMEGSVPVKRVFLFAAAAIAIAFLTICRVSSWSGSYLTADVSDGIIADLPLSDETYYESTLTAFPGSIGIGFHVSYPLETTINDEAIHVRIYTEETEYYNGDLLLRNAGYTGDKINEGVLIAEFSTPTAENEELHISVSGRNLPEEMQASLRTKAGSSRMSPLTGNGEQTEEFFYASLYVPYASDDRNRRILEGILLEIVLLLLAFFSFRRSSSLERISLHASAFKSVSVGKKRHARIRLRHLGLLALILAGECAALEFGSYAGIQKSYDAVKEYGKKSSDRIPLRTGDSVRFPVTPDEPFFSGIEILMDIGYHMDARVRLSLLNPDTGAELQSVIYTSEDLLSDESDGTRRILFPEIIEASAEKTYTAELTFLEGTDLFSVVLAKASSKKETERIPYFRLTYRSYAFLHKFFLLICSILLLGTVLLWYLILAGAPGERIAFVVLLSAGICFSLLVLPYCVRDEYYHFDEAYKISNSLLGIKDSPVPEAIYKRKCDIVTDVVRHQKLDAYAYNWEEKLFKAGFRKSGQNPEELVLCYARPSGRDTSWLYYLPSAVGITIGRILHLPFLGIFYLGRFINLFLAASVCMWCMKHIPVGKIILPVLMLLPHSVSILASYSYDSMIIVAAFAATAVCVGILLHRERTEPSELMLFLLLILLLARAKAGIYAFILLPCLPAVIRRMAAGTKADSTAGTDLLHTKEKKQPEILQKLRLLIFTVIAVIIMIFVFQRGLSWLRQFSSAAGGSYNARKETAVYTIGYLLNHPARLFRLIEGTLYKHIYTPAALAGDNLGWVYKLDLNRGVCLAFQILAVLSAISLRNEPSLSRRVRAALAAAFLAAASLVCLAMTTWTDLGQIIISGLQGRYFLPVLPLLLLALRGRSVEWNKDPSGALLFAGHILTVLSVVSFVVRAFG